MQDILDRLTTRHPVTFERDHGPEQVLVDPLIKQLRDAIYGEDGRNGGTAESRARLPLSAPALDLYQEIDDWVTEVWVQRFQRVPGAEHVEQLLAEWAEGLTEGSFVAHTVKTTVRTTRGVRVESEFESTTALEFLDKIESRIVALLERPTVQVPVTGPCPAVGCFASTFTYWVNGEQFESPTLEFTRDQRTGDTLTVSCRSCGAQWDRSRFREFTEALAATERGIKPHQMAALRAMA